MIGTLCHGKDCVDYIHASDKRYLKGKMCMIETLEADDYSKKIKHTQWLTMHITVLQKSARGYVNVVKERMDQRVLWSWMQGKTKILLCTKQYYVMMIGLRKM